MLALEPTARLVMPRPISTNNLFSNVAGRGRVQTQDYRTWKKEAAACLMAQRPLPRFALPVKLTIYVGEKGVGMMDSDNVSKAYIDTLVQAGVIKDDSRKWVRRTAPEWVPGMAGAVIVIEAATVEPRAADIIASVPAGIRGYLT